MCYHYSFKATVERYDLNEFDEQSEKYEETDHVVCLTEAEKDRYRNLFASVLVPYDGLQLGDAIGEGILTRSVGSCLYNFCHYLGAFGKVFKGQLSMEGFKAPRDVAIKTIKSMINLDRIIISILHKKNIQSSF